jgi:hypothetical protein
MGNSKEAKTFLCFRFEAKNLKRNKAKRKRKNWPVVFAIACENKAKRILFRFEANKIFKRNRRTLIIPFNSVIILCVDQSEEEKYFLLLRSWLKSKGTFPLSLLITSVRLRTVYRLIPQYLVRLSL